MLSYLNLIELFTYILEYFDIMNIKFVIHILKVDISLEMFLSGDIKMIFKIFSFNLCLCDNFVRCIVAACWCHCFHIWPCQNYTKLKFISLLIFNISIVVFLEIEHWNFESTDRKFVENRLHVNFKQHNKAANLDLYNNYIEGVHRQL